MNINTHVGRQLRLRRTGLGITQDAVARGIGITAQQVQKYEKGVNVMNVIRLHQFAQFLHVPISYFFEGIQKQAKPSAFTPVEEHSDDEDAPVSERESTEIIKSFRRIKDRALRKRLADLLRTISLKEI